MYRFSLVRAPLLHALAVALDELVPRLTLARLQIFHEVEQAGSKFLEQIEQHLRRYMATTQQGFAHLTETADEHFANASRRPGDTVNRLDEHLQDLTDILERLGRVGGGNGRS